MSNDVYVVFRVPNQLTGLQGFSRLCPAVPRVDDIVEHTEEAYIITKVAWKEAGEERLQPICYLEFIK